MMNWIRSFEPFLLPLFLQGTLLPVDGGYLDGRYGVAESRNFTSLFLT